MASNETIKVPAPKELRYRNKKVSVAEIKVPELNKTFRFKTPEGWSYQGRKVERLEISFDSEGKPYISAMEIGQWKSGSLYNQTLYAQFGSPTWINSGVDF